MKNFRSGEDDKNGGIPIWVHITIILLIVAIIAFAVIKLSIWNKGFSIDTSDVNASDYDVEMLDQIFVLTDDKLEGHEDDGEETILVLGNDAITYDTSETGVCEQIAKKTGANVINAGFPGSTIALKNAEFSDSYPLDRFSFYNVAESICSENFSDLLETAAGYTDYTYSQSTYNLQDLDFNKVDTLVIYYDATDYISLRPGWNPGDKQDPMTYMGALSSGIKDIQEKYPFIRIVCMSYTFCYAYDTDGALKNGDRVDFGNGKLTTYLQHMIDTCGDTGVSFVDNYYGTIDEGNSSDYLLDNIHVNQACNEHIASHFAKVIYDKE